MRTFLPLTLLAILLGWTLPGAAGAAEVATGKPTTASSTHTSAGPPSSATDGNSTTRWSSNYADNQWITVDLGSVQTVNKTEVNWEAAYARTYRVQVSTDGTSFTTVASVSRTSSGLATTTFSDVSARYVRLQLDTRGTAYGFSIWDWRVYTAVPIGDPEVARGDPASASSTHISAGAASAANDGSVATRWSSNYVASGEWWRVDLGSTYALSKVEIDWQSASASPYSIQVSNDGTTWTTLATQTLTVDVPATPAYVTITTALAGSGRYLRILQGGRGPGNCCYGMSFWEARVYGAASAPPPPVDSDGDGVVDGSDLCPGTPSGTQVDPTGCPVVVPPPTTVDAGLVRPHRPLQSNMDATVSAAVNGDAAAKAYLERFESFRVWSNNGAYPADEAYNQGWLNPGFTYRDTMLGSYVGQADNALGESAYLHDTNGNRLYIKFECSGGSCSQYVGDIGNPALRQQYVNGLAYGVARSGGVFMDDANFDMAATVSNGAGTTVTPVDPRTGQLMTEAEWRGYMLQFVKDVKAAYPNARVVINTVYFHAGGALSKPEIKEALDVADGWEFERGFGDTGIVAGTGKYGFDTIKAVNDYVHSVGGFVIHDVQSNALGRVYPEAAYLCFNGGQDYYFHTDMSPSNAWDALWNKNLGDATSECTPDASGIYHRSFTGGSVTVNPATKTGSIG